MYLQHHYEVNIVSPFSHPWLFMCFGKSLEGVSLWDETYYIGRRGDLCLG